MITIHDSIPLPLTEAEIKTVMQKALAQFDIAKRDNLRHRHVNIQFDCILRGYLGEFVINKWLTQHGIKLASTNFISDGDNIDIDFLYKGLNIELKTSLVPDADVTIETVIAKRDIKIIQREKLIEHLKADIHLQILYDQRRKAKDDWLQAQCIDFAKTTIDELYILLLAKAYTTTCYFVGWVDKNTLIKNLSLLPKLEQAWSFKNSKRQFWNCKIKESNKPNDLINFLQSV